MSTFFLFAILAISAVAGAYVRPFIRKRDNIMDSLSLMTLVVTYFFAALRQAYRDDTLSSGAEATVIVVLILNVLTLLGLAVCICLDIKDGFVGDGQLQPKRSAEPVSIPADVEAHANPLNGLRQGDTAEEIIEMTEGGPNEGMESLARDNQSLVSQLKAMQIEIEGLRQRPLVTVAN
jgi:hypothetical protein